MHHKIEDALVNPSRIGAGSGLYVAIGIELVSKSTAPAGKSSIAGPIRNITHEVVRTCVAVQNRRWCTRLKRSDGVELPATNCRAEDAVGQVFPRQFVEQRSDETMGMIGVGGAVRAFRMPLTPDHLHTVLAAFAEEGVHLLGPRPVGQAG